MIGRLSGVVTLRGRNPFGRETELTLTPISQPGWWWQTKAGLYPINQELIRPGRRHLQLTAGDETLHAAEHLLPLAYLGLTGVTIGCSHGWPPYDGCASELHNAVSTRVITTPGELAWATLNRPLDTGPLGQRGKCEHRVTIYPRDEPGVELHIGCSFKGLGEQSLDLFVHPQVGGWQQVLTAKTPGWPAWLYWLSRFGHWSHHQHIAWPQVLGEETLDHFVAHRALDILGALSMVSSWPLIACTVVSSCGGHRDDIRLLTEPDVKPIPLIVTQPISAV